MNDLGVPPEEKSGVRLSPKGPLCGGTRFPMKNRESSDIPIAIGSLNPSRGGSYIEVVLILKCILVSKQI